MLIGPFRLEVCDCISTSSHLSHPIHSTGVIPLVVKASLQDDPSDA